MSSEGDEQQCGSAGAAGEKLQKVLARAGLGSRREMEAAIAAGRVQVAGRTARLGDRVGPRDPVELDGRLVQRVHRQPPARVLLYNKPEGEITTRSDPEGRKTVFHKLPRTLGRWIAVGRLDINSQGLLLFTTDGELANALMHPSSGVEREYACRIRGAVTEEMVQVLVDGVELEDGPAHFDVIESGMPLDDPQESANAWFHVIVSEGRKREVRRLWESQGVTVSRLIRVRYGPIVMPRDLRQGRLRELDQTQLVELYRHVGLEPPARQRAPAASPSATAKRRRRPAPRRRRSPAR
ncbi:23S rRNA pseudouridylate synthase B [Halorhodospira abdelmalekii]|uniref:23S rRNA pseudouridine(2605) synthase RluB n=1 Tax=Halorhodospira abdelmalekii TaxID=421629 RepID=UPI001906B552|nr:pseudouridine synthase [Halorhodospira abdelmalekii]MBK1734539.1 23S rRNA pseudouridylate synthase B [Halorhodospira abdelmalekii]